MKFESVSIDVLLPIDHCLRNNFEIFLKEFNPALVRSKYPIPVISYGLRRGEQRYILGDGHHRSAALYLCGDKVPLKILETDDEISKCNEGAFDPDFFTSKKLFLRYYKENWKPILENSGIRSIPDLVHHAYTPEKLKDLEEIARNAKR